MLLADFEGLPVIGEPDREGRKVWSQDSNHAAVSPDSGDAYAANEWLCHGFERSGALFLAENFLESMLILWQGKKKSVSHSNEAPLDWVTTEPSGLKGNIKGRRSEFSYCGPDCLPDSPWPPPLLPCHY